MPYIKHKRRNQIAVDGHLGNAPVAGDLNYCLGLLIEDYLRSKGLSYQNLNDVVGALECTKMELYRRMIGPYEDEAVGRNGDISLYSVPVLKK